MSHKNAVTVPAMPAAMKRPKHTPTLVMKMPVEKAEEEEERERIRIGRYSLIRDLVPRPDK